MFGCCFLENCSFLKENGEGVDVEERGGSRKLGVVEGGETVVRIYCMEEESIFKKKKNFVTL